MAAQPLQPPTGIVINVEEGELILFGDVVIVDVLVVGIDIRAC